MFADTNHPIETAPGACYLGEGRCQFVVWAPSAGSFGLLLQRDGEDAIPMAAEENGYYRLLLSGVAPGTPYQYVLSGGKIRPDPGSNRREFTVPLK
jgi:maltooligosyltrehalose trehalohydrolase